MPKVTRLFIKSGLVYLFLGIIMAFVAELPQVNTGVLLLPVYWHMIVIGWVTQVIMGVSIWMFPRRKRSREKIESVPALLSFWTLNSGLILRFTAEPFIPLFQGNSAITSVVVISTLLHIAAVLFYLTEIWPRVFMRKNVKRKKQ
jgi:hypothetical protein